MFSNSDTYSFLKTVGELILIYFYQQHYEFKCQQTAWVINNPNKFGVFSSVISVFICKIL